MAFEKFYCIYLFDGFKILTILIRRLNDTFRECTRPKIGWQIDSFGHSGEQESMFAQMGFDGLLFSRLDSQDR